MSQSTFADDSETPRVAPLSARETQVLAMTAQGMTNREVGQQLCLSVHAVKFHLAAIYRKLGVANRTEAAVAYITSGDATTNPTASEGRF